MDLHALLKFAGGLLALVLFLPLVMDALQRGGAGQSFATWLLWALLDAILAASIIRQHGNYLIVVGFTVGDGVMAAALLWKHRVIWGRFETAVLALVLGCLVVWNISGPRGVTIAGTVAICVAGLPGLVALWKNPDRRLATIWALYALANAVSFFGGTAMTLEERFAPGVFAIFALALAVAGLRPASLARAGKKTL
jgi:hypothetical protein